MSSRLETFRAMVAQHPDNVLARFGLANEALKEGLHAEAAEQLRAYLAAYDDEGNGFGRLALALEKLGRIDEAKDALHAGIAAARRSTSHTRGSTRRGGSAIREWRRSSRRAWRSWRRGEPYRSAAVALFSASVALVKRVARSFISDCASA